jgi:hypothetical protein
VSDYLRERGKVFSNGRGGREGGFPSNGGLKGGGGGP